jgi:ParB family chromosome partitioning protein
MAATRGSNVRGLGKGISALMDDDDEPSVVALPSASQDAPNQGVREIAVSQIVPGKFQPRRHFDSTALQELADSIAQHGIMQPLLLRTVDAHRYEIVAGERRWRAAQLAGLAAVPSIVRILSDTEALELALIENIQRQDLNLLEEAEGYARLMEEFHHTQEALAATVGKSRSHVANMMRLLHLPQEVRVLLEEGKISAGHARALLVSSDPLAHAERVIVEQLSVRQTEQLVKGMLDKGIRGSAAKPRAGDFSPQPSYSPTEKSDDALLLEEALSNNIGMKVEIFERGQAGQIVINYQSLAELDDVLRRLGGVA